MALNDCSATTHDGDITMKRVLLTFAALAAVTMAAMAEFKLPHDIVNVNGGADSP